MAPSDLRAEILEGDCLEVMATLEAESAASIVCDPPYGLSFMGKAWDHGVPGAPYWREALRVAKPGAHLVAFGGTRTFHRLACAIEDAGWEIRDTLTWLYGSGFPKSLDVSKAIDRQRNDREEVLEVTAWIRSARDAAGRTNAQIDEAFGFAGMAGHWTSSKTQPAVPTLDQVPRLLEALGSPEVPERIERLLLDLNGRKGEPGAAWFQRERLGTRTAGIVPIDHATRRTVGGVSREFDVTAPATDAARTWEGWGTALKPAWEPIILARKPLGGTVAAIVLEHGTGAINVDRCRVGDTGGTAGANYAKTGAFGIGGRCSITQPASGRWPANLILDEEAAAMLDEQSGVQTSGVAVNRNRPAEGSVYGGPTWNIPHPRGPDVTYGDTGGAARFFYCAKASTEDREDGNRHPTVKPTALMTWLVRLVTPPGGLVLDPFCGSGSTGKAAALEGFPFLGIDADPGSAKTARERIERARRWRAANPPLPFEPVVGELARAAAVQRELFGASDG